MRLANDYGKYRPLFRLYGSDGVNSGTGGLVYRHLCCTTRKVALFSSPDSREYRLVFLGPCTSCGLALVIAASPTLYVLVQALGAVILAFLGYRNWVSPAVSFAADSADNPASKANLRQTFVSGVLLSLTNPVLLAGLVATFPQCIDPSAPYLTQATVLVTLCTMVYFAGQVFYGFLALAARGYLLGHGLWGLLKKASAVLFWLFALGIFVRLFS